MVKIWRAHAGRAPARAPQATTSWSSTRPATGPRARDAALAADVRRDRARRADRRDRPSSVRELLGDPAPLRATWRWRTGPRWRSPRRSSCSDGLAEATRARARRGGRQRRCCRGASAPRSWSGSSASWRARERGSPGDGAGRRSPRRTRARAVSRPRALPAQPARAPAPPRLRGAARCRSCATPSSTSRRSRRSRAGARCSSTAREGGRATGRSLLDAEAVEQALVARASRAGRARTARGAPARPSSRSSSLARGRPDRLDHPARRADQDPLLRVALDPDQRPHAHARPGTRPLDLLDHDLDRVRAPPGRCA